ncbi:related to tetracycline resistance proteins [Fusarium torulosum]|uniref:Related to tetracycline resistance proteins n=1 Tax=Fusarium torulosum TaxID=33205 RepID=A0AAE8M6A1_9HYPO|nr:related to tetracycline resistance proteins [Fusarium torulosum]
MAEPLPSATPTGDTRGQPAPDETVPTFHSFPKLPAEIRLQIWKYACFPRSKIDHGIQYVTVNIVHEDEEEYIVVLDDNLEGYDDEFLVETDDDGYITLTAPRRPGDKPAGVQRSSSRPNASACLWDAGLLTACKESKLAITEYHDLKGWLELRDQSNKTTQPDVWYDKDYPSTLVPHKRDKKWCPMVVPLRDIFCIDTSRVKTLPKNLYSMKLLAPFISTRTFTIVESWNIALKFDSSWNTDFPYHIGRLKREKSPRGLLANWLDRFQDEVYPEPSVWIIDDSVGWVASREQNFRPMYRDCDGDYVQINWDDTRCNGGRGHVAHFMEFLSDVLDSDDDIFPFETKKIVKLLVRKDNQLSRELEEDFELSDATRDDSEEDSWNEDNEDNDDGDGSGEEVD